MGDNEYPEELPGKVSETADVDMNNISGFKYSPYGLYETAGTMNSGWSFKYFDQNWLTPGQVRSRREKLNSMGINYLLNVGPDGLGRIPSFSQEVLLKAKE